MQLTIHQVYPSQFYLDYALKCEMLSVHLKNDTFL